MAMEDGKLVINNEECNRCMHCINVMPRALRPGVDTGVSVLFGAKAPILEGAQLSVLTIPFMKAEPLTTTLKSSSKRSGIGGLRKVKTVNAWVS